MNRSAPPIIVTTPASGTGEAPFRSHQQPAPVSDRSIHWARWRLPHDATAPTHARRAARQQLSQWKMSDLAATTELLVSELVTNAVIHGAGPVRLAFRKTSQTLVCEITDDADTMPRPGNLSSDKETGRGLRLVEVLSSGWGVCRLSRGKIVWFELTSPTDRETE